MMESVPVYREILTILHSIVDCDFYCVSKADLVGGNVA